MCRKKNVLEWVKFIDLLKKCLILVKMLLLVLLKYINWIYLLIMNVFDNLINIMCILVDISFICLLYFLGILLLCFIDNRLRRVYKRNFIEIFIKCRFLLVLWVIYLKIENIIS